MSPETKDSDLPSPDSLKRLGEEELRSLAVQLLQEIDRRDKSLRDITRELEDVKESLKVTREEVGRLVQADPLTGMAHRTEFERRLTREWARLNREGGEISVILLDVDELERFNSSSGLEKGDEILRRVADCLRSNVWRPADFVARYGEDEFALLLPNTGLDGAEAIADRLHRAVAAMHMTPPEGGQARYVSVSVGVAARNPGRGHAGTLVAEAEQALFVAKKEGKNRVVVSELAQN